MQELILGDRYVGSHNIGEAEQNAGRTKGGAELVLARGSNTKEEPVGAHADEGASVEEDERWQVDGESEHC